MSASLLLALTLFGGHGCGTAYGGFYPSAAHYQPYYGPVYQHHGYYRPMHRGGAHYAPAYAQPGYRAPYHRSSPYGPQAPRPYGASPDGRRQTQAAAVVEMTDQLRFQPRQLTIRVGDTVEWRNTSRMVHTVTADPNLARDPSHVVLPEGARAFDSGDIRPGGRYTHTFTVPGTYRYFCIPHEEQGMLGEVVVRAAQ